MTFSEKDTYLRFLEESFPDLKTNIERCETMGIQWESRPFFKKEGKTILSHVGFLDYPMLIEGRWYKVGALHAICSKMTHRGQGLASTLIQEALDWAKTQYDFVILYTEIPKFYEKLSFQPIQEYRFHLKGRRPKGSQPLLPLSTPKDNPLLFQCFQNRAPTSNHLWVKENGNITAFNALFATYPNFWSLYYSPSLNAILSYELEDKTLHLFDIISDKIPSLDSILDQMPAEIDEIYFYFSPDLLTDQAIIEPLLYDNTLGDFSGYLMVHGNWPKVKPFMIPLLSRC
jgi:GNAT superfamily N-acetyltransferase